MPTRHPKAFLYLLGVTLAVASVLPTALPASNSSVGAPVNLIQANCSQDTNNITANTASSTDEAVDDVIQVHTLGTVDGPLGDISIKKGGGGAGSRGSWSSGSSAGSGYGNPFWYPFGGDLFGSSSGSAGTVDGSKVVMRVMASVCATVLVSYYTF
jgi:hypothetical protein